MTDQVALNEVPPLSNAQRLKVREYYAANPDGGYKSALAHAGIRATQAAAKAAVLGDDELADEPFRALKIDEGSAFKAIGDILADPSHKDRLRAATFVLSALHGVREKSEVAMTGTVEVESGDLAAALERFTTTIGRLTSRAQSSGDVRGLARAAAELPPAAARN